MNNCIFCFRDTPSGSKRGHLSLCTQDPIMPTPQAKAWYIGGHSKMMLYYMLCQIGTPFLVYVRFKSSMIDGETWIYILNKEELLSNL